MFQVKGSGKSINFKKALSNKNTDVVFPDAKGISSIHFQELENTVKKNKLKSKKREFFFLNTVFKKINIVQ